MAPYTLLRSPFKYFSDSRRDPLLAGLGVFIASVIGQIATVLSLFYVIVDQVASDALRPAAIVGIGAFLFGIL